MSEAERWILPVPNRLAAERSLYLRQHADNPIDWYAWGDEAFAAARAADRPLFLSFGYSSCHWCHVMAHESFEDPAIGELLRGAFIAVKIDREEHPEIDAQYMTALVALAGHGGWPMSVFALPDGRPFFAGTYFPPAPRWGQPGFADLLRHVAGLWSSRRADLERDAERLAETVRRRSAAPVSAQPDPGFAKVLAATMADVDTRHGGHVGAPKFPPHEDLLLWQHARRHGVPIDGLDGALRLTLDRMIWSGLRDQIGGAFHRYCVDEAWRVPHFEQMLYDNASLLAILAGAVADGNDPDDRGALASLVERLGLDWRTPGGWLAAAFDADDAGGEGGFYTWTPEELRSALGADDAAWAARWFQVEAHGPVEGRSTLHPVAAPGALRAADGFGTADEVRGRLARISAALAEARAPRPRPDRDDKGVVAWNGLALLGLAEARRVLGDSVTAVGAPLAAVLGGWAADPAALPRAVYEGGGRGRAQLEDVAGLGLGLWRWGLLADDPAAIDAALALAGPMIERFGAGGVWRAADAEGPLGSPAGWMDGQTPSAFGLALEWLVELAEVVGRPEDEAARDALLAGVGPALAAHPGATRRLRRVVDRMQRGLPVCVLTPAAADWFDALAPAAGAQWLWLRPRAAARLAELGAASTVGRALDPAAPATGWACLGRSCRLPAASAEALAVELRAAATGRALG